MLNKTNPTLTQSAVGLKFKENRYPSKNQKNLTCGKGEELSPNSKHGTEQAFVGGEPEDISVYDLPAIVSLVQVVTACFLLHIVPAGEMYDKALNTHFPLSFLKQIDKLIVTRIFLHPYNILNNNYFTAWC